MGRISEKFFFGFLTSHKLFLLSLCSFSHSVIQIPFVSFGYVLVLSVSLYLCTIIACFQSSPIIYTHIAHTIRSQSIIHLKFNRLKRNIRSIQVKSSRHHSSKLIADPNFAYNTTLRSFIPFVHSSASVVSLSISELIDSRS